MADTLPNNITAGDSGHIGDHEELHQLIDDEWFTPEQYGAVGDEVTNDTNAINDAIDAASAVGGIIKFRPVPYKVTTLNLKSNVIFQGAHSAINYGSGFGTTIVGTAGSDIFAFPATNTANIHFRDLKTVGGRRGLANLNEGTAHSYLTAHNFQISTPSDECVYIEGAIEEWYWDVIHLQGGTYGFRKPDLGDYVGINYIDKSEFANVTINGEGTQLRGWSVEVNLLNNVILRNPIVYRTKREAGYFAGGIRSLAIIEPNTEGVVEEGKRNETTGSISSGSPTLTVASATGYANGDPVTVKGAGAGGIDLHSTVSSIAGNVITLAGNASTTVASAPVTNATYDEWRFAALPSSAQPVGVHFFGGIIGTTGTAGGPGTKARYGVHIQSGYDFTFNGTRINNFPLYDPGGAASLFGDGYIQPRWPAITSSPMWQLQIPNANSENWPYAVVPSPKGKDLIVALRDSNDDGTGTYGEFAARKRDTNRTKFWSVDTNGVQHLIEAADPGVAPANGARLYARDNGAGKTQLVVIFSSGAVQVLATEP